MKKKGILILAVILLSSIMIYFSKGLQRTAQDKLLESNAATENRSNIKTEVENKDKDGKEENKKQPTEIANNSDGKEEDKNKSSKTEEVKIQPTEPEQENKKQEDKKPEAKEADKPKREEKTPEEKAVTEEKKSSPNTTPNFIVFDQVSNKEIYSCRIGYDGNTSLATYTKEALKAAGISYRINSSGYVSMINELYDYPSMPNKQDKKDWTSCGWVFYINNTKASIGPKEYKPKETDIIIWRYWKDAIYEK